MVLDEVCGFHPTGRSTREIDSLPTVPDEILGRARSAFAGLPQVPLPPVHFRQ